MLLDPRRPRLGWVSGDLVQAPHPSLRLTSAQNFQSEARAALSEDFLYWGVASYPVKSRGARLPERQPAVPFSVVLFIPCKAADPRGHLAFEHVASRGISPKNLTGPSRPKTAARCARS
jgi:hypothetical protein